MPSGYGSGAADGLQEVLARLFLEQKQRQLVAQQQAELAENQRQANQRHGIAEGQLGLGRDRLGLDRDEFGQRRREYDEAAPQRSAILDHTVAQTGDIKSRPEREAAGRQHAIDLSKLTFVNQGERDRAQHGYQLREIGARGAEERSVAGIRATNEPLLPVQQDDGTIVYMPRRQAAGQRPPMSAALRTQADALKTVGEALRALKTQSDALNTEEGVTSRIAGGARGIAGAIGIDPKAKVYQDTRAAQAVRLSRALGEVGAMTNQDIERALGLLPDLRTSRTEASQKFQQLQDIINAALKAKGMPALNLADESATTADPVDALINKYRTRK